MTMTIRFATMKKTKTINMRKLITLLFAWAACCAAWADDLTENLKFGRPTKAEMELTEYAPEPDAVALVLCSLRDEHYTFTDGAFQRVVEHKVRIKVLKSEGTDYANVSCLYQSSKSNNFAVKEYISGVSATAYNLEGEKTVATKMKNDLVFRERVNDDVMMLKFTIPQVKVGTVMEYTYTEHSDNDLQIDDWYAQHEIPVLYTRFTLAVPECYVFAVDNTGAFPLEAKTSQGHMTLSLGGAESTTFGTTTYSFVGRSIPSLRDDDNVWCINDYRAKVAFEFERTVYPLDTKSYTSTWEQIAELLMKDTDFGGRLSNTSPLKDEMAALQLDTLATVDEKVSAIFSLLMSRVEWNGEYNLFSTKRASAVLKDGTGSNADINFLLIAMLRSIGIDACPLVIRIRHHGHLPLSHPSLKKLDTFVVAFSRTPSSAPSAGSMPSTLISLLAAGNDGWGVLDASSKSGYIDAIPPQLMPDRGLLVEKNVVGWADLTEKCSAREVTRIAAEVVPASDGSCSIVGSRTNHYFLESSLGFKESRKDRTEAEAVEQVAQDIEAKVSDYTITDTDAFTPSATESYRFEKSVQSGDSIIYINPFVFQIWDENPYTNERRDVPVERLCKFNQDYAVTLTIPEGYDVEELPTAVNLKSPDNSISCKVLFSKKGNVLNVAYRYQLRRLLFLPDEYADLKQVYDFIYAKCNEMIAIKKL